MSSLQTPYVSLSLARLRRGVTICCWIVGLSLVTQILVWGMATFMDVRYGVLPDRSPSPLIVAPGEAAPSGSMGGAISSAANNGQLADPTAPVDPNRVPTKNDVMMAKATKFAYGAGMLGLIVLLPMLFLGSVLAASACTPGVEKTVSAFLWSLAVALMVLPLGHLLGLPWTEGALVSYGHMTQQVDLQITDDANSWGTPTFYCRFALLPLTCVVGLTVVGMGFSAGVSAGILPKEDLRLDPVLEREAANIAPTSLHGGRAAAALRATTVSAAPVSPAVAAVAKPSSPSITQL